MDQMIQNQVHSSSGIHSKPLLEEQQEQIVLSLLEPRQVQDQVFNIDKQTFPHVYRFGLNLTLLDGACVQYSTFGG